MDYVSEVAKELVKPHVLALVKTRAKDVSILVPAVVHTAVENKFRGSSRCHLPK